MRLPTGARVAVMIGGGTTGIAFGSRLISWDVDNVSRISASAIGVGDDDFEFVVVEVEDEEEE